MEQLWSLYSHSVFLMEQKLAADLSFAIITAFNPADGEMSVSANRHKDFQLQQRLELLNIVSREVYGCSPDLQHWEKSWAIVTDKAQALSLAKEFQQNAIFWVEQDKLYLTPCLLAQCSECYLGQFSSKIVGQRLPV